MAKQLEQAISNSSIITTTSSGTTTGSANIGSISTILSNPAGSDRLGLTDDTIDWFKKLAVPPSGYPPLSPGPSTTAAPSTLPHTFTAPWTSGHKSALEPVMEPQDKFAAEMETLVNQKESITYGTLISNMRAAISKVTQVSIELQLKTNFDKDTNVVTVELVLSAAGVEEKTIVRINRVLRRPDESVAESMLAELIEICMMRGVYNMVKAELGLTDNPEM